LAGIYNDVELFYERSLLDKPVEPPHIGCPYGYCEEVDGARRFLLAHELGHARVLDIGGAHCLSALPERTTHYGFALLDSLEWREELFCDQFAVCSILDVYRQADLEGELLNELEGALVGVLTLFTLFDLVGGATGSAFATESHPPALLRRDWIRLVIKSHPVYERCDALRKVLFHNWGLLNSFRRLASGLYSPNSFASGEFKAALDFDKYLSPFGRRARGWLFKHYSGLPDSGHFSSQLRWAPKDTQ
jgi:hypothetical protein